jgi:hypothetical protein
VFSLSSSPLQAVAAHTWSWLSPQPATAATPRLSSSEVHSRAPPASHQSRASAHVFLPLQAKPLDAAAEKAALTLSWALAQTPSLSLSAQPSSPHVWREQLNRYVGATVGGNKVLGAGDGLCVGKCVGCLEGFP